MEISAFVSSERAGDIGIARKKLCTFSLASSVISLDVKGDDSFPRATFMGDTSHLSWMY